jgi:hypothetical protein
MRWAISLQSRMRRAPRPRLSCHSSMSRFASAVHVAPARFAASLAASSASKPRARGVHLRRWAGCSILISARRTIAAGSWASLAQFPNSWRGLTIRPSRRRFAARLNSGVRLQHSVLVVGQFLRRSAVLASAGLAAASARSRWRLLCPAATPCLKLFAASRGASRIVGLRFLLRRAPAGRSMPCAAAMSLVS